MTRSHNGNASRVLVVEDDEGIREMLKYNLSTAGFTVQEASDGASGLRSARTSRPDLILLDLMLPGMSGFDFCRALRKNSRVPIIMITAKDAEIDKIVGLSRSRCARCWRASTLCFGGHSSTRASRRPRPSARRSET